MVLPNFFPRDNARLQDDPGVPGKDPEKEMLVAGSRYSWRKIEMTA